MHERDDGTEHTNQQDDNPYSSNQIYGDPVPGTVTGYYPKIYPEYPGIQWSFGNGSQMCRSYKCPRCGGEFMTWEQKDEKNVCPFCALEQFSYKKDETKDG
jgi:DNA-directed RNA polymerase subunit RPC12/RpoP